MYINTFLALKSVQYFKNLSGKGCLNLQDLQVIQTKLHVFSKTWTIIHTIKHKIRLSSSVFFLYVSLKCFLFKNNYTIHSMLEICIATLIEICEFQIRKFTGLQRIYSVLQFSNSKTRFLTKIEIWRVVSNVQ